MKKYLLTFLLAICVAVFVTALYFFIKNDDVKSLEVDPVSSYEDVLKSAESHLLVPTSQDVVKPVTLTDMLESGIRTLNGTLSSKKMPSGETFSYSLMLDNKTIGVETVSQIELVKAFMVESQQVLLLGLNQGGNQCDRQYQFIMINSSKYSLSKVFGSCLPVTSVFESSNDIYVVMPQNDPYIGDNVVVTYRYSYGKIKTIKKSNNQILRQMYKNLTAKQIIQLASKDYCYQDGVMLDSSSCGGGRKYCAMFKSLKTPKKDSNYYILKDFCS